MRACVCACEQGGAGKGEEVMALCLHKVHTHVPEKVHAYTQVCMYSLLK